MSRLFSRLENMGHDHDEGAPSALPDEQGRQADAHDRYPAPGFSDSLGPPTTHGAGSGIPALMATAKAPTIPPLVPGYSISSSLAVPRSGMPVATRPVWPVRIWLVSLLLLIGLSLLILAMPDRLPSLALQKRLTPTPTAAPAATSAARAPVVKPESPAAPSASAIITPLPSAPAPRAETHGGAAAPAPAARRPSDGAACRDAMLAMNLCSKSSP